MFVFQACYSKVFMVASCDLLAGCSNYCCNNIKELIDSEVVAPFVAITITSPDGSITVGNQSSPQAGNHAAINSLKYSFSCGADKGGFLLELEIVDDQGGSFDTFISHLVTVMDWDKIKNQDVLTVSWGWLNAACSSSAVTNEGQYRVTPKRIFRLQKINYNYDKGLIKYRLTCYDLERLTQSTSINGVWGDDKNGVELKQAIRSI